MSKEVRPFSHTSRFDFLEQSTILSTSNYFFVLFLVWSPWRLSLGAGRRGKKHDTSTDPDDGTFVESDLQGSVIYRPHKRRYRNSRGTKKHPLLNELIPLAKSKRTSQTILDGGVICYDGR